MKKFFALLTIACALSLTTGCIAVGVAAVGASGIVYSKQNDAVKAVEYGMFECCSALDNVLQEIGVEVVKKKSTHPKESIYKFDYQNLSYTVEFDHMDIGLTKITVGAVSNAIFKNRPRAAEMIQKIEANLK